MSRAPVKFSSEHVPGAELFLVSTSTEGKALIRAGVSRGAIYSPAEVSALSQASPRPSDLRAVMLAKLIFGGVLVSAGKPAGDDGPGSSSLPSEESRA